MKYKLSCQSKQHNNNGGAEVVEIKNNPYVAVMVIRMSLFVCLRLNLLTDLFKVQYCKFSLKVVVQFRFSAILVLEIALYT